MPTIPSSTNKPLKLSDTLNFGKYKGKTLEDVITLDVKYVQYLVEELGKQLDNEAYREYEENLRYEI